MRETKSLVAKTFVFTGILILSVLLVVLSILYLVLPGYYFNQKQKTFEADAVKLAEEISGGISSEELTEKLYMFAVVNNAEIVTYDEKGYYHPMYSTPYLTLQNIQLFTSGETIGSDIVSVYSVSPAEESQAATVIANSGEQFTEPDIEAAKVSIRIEERAITSISPAEALNVVVENPRLSNDLLTATIGVVHPEVGTIMAYGSLQPIDEASQVILSLFPILLFVSLILGLPLAYIYARQLTNPIVSLSKTALLMQDMSPEIRANIESNNEIGTLSKNLNYLYETLINSISQLEEERNQVKKLEQSKTQLMQSASHELKTPIAALNGIIEGMIDGVGVYKDRDTYLRVSKEQIDKLNGLVQEILSASQGDNQSLILEDISLHKLVSQVLADQKTLMDQKNLTLDLSMGTLAIHTDIGLFKRALSNLITNAVAYSPPETTLTVSANEGVITIKNTAPPINLDELSHLTEPFYTPNFSRDRTNHGTGLGLYIASQNLTRLGYSLKLDYHDPYFTAAITL